MNNICRCESILIDPYRLERIKNQHLSTKVAVADGSKTSHLSRGLLEGPAAEPCENVRSLFLHTDR